MDDSSLTGSRNKQTMVSMIMISVVIIVIIIIIPKQSAVRISYHNLYHHIVNHE